MKMQFKVESEAHSQEIQEALFAAGYDWEHGAGSIKYQDRAYIRVGYWQRGFITIGDECRADDGFEPHVVVDGKIYKEGEEPKKLVNKFKVGDKVKCIKSSVFNSVREGEEYTVDDVSTVMLDQPSVKVSGGDGHWYESRFELVEDVVPEPKTYGNMKFRISSPEHSKQVQEALFKAGFKWSGTSTLTEHLGADFLYAEVSSGGAKYICWSNKDGIDDEFFEEQTQYVETVLLDGEFVPVELVRPSDMVVVDELVVEEPGNGRPPLGLRPRRIFEEEVAQLYKERLLQILEAMQRYAFAGMVIPDAWDDEYNHLRELLNEYYSQ